MVNSLSVLEQKPLHPSQVLITSQQAFKLADQQF